MTKVYRRTSLPALDNSKSVQNPDLLNIADKNYTTTIMRYSNLALLFSQLDTNDKHIVGAINELNTKVQPAKRVGETDVVGGVIIGDGINVTEEGVISTIPYELPPATTETLGGVIVGDNLTVTSEGRLSANAQQLEPATTETLGGIIVGNNLSITEDGILSATAQELEPATASKLGGIKVGDYLNITSEGTLSVDSSAVGKTYYSGKLTTIDDQNKINVNMTKSTPQDIEQESADNPNVLFFTEGQPSGGTTINSTTITLDYTDWDSTDNTIDVTVSGITSISKIIVSPDPLNISDYLECNIYALSQDTNIIIFRCTVIPEVDITVNIAYWEDAT